MNKQYRKQVSQNGVVSFSMNSTENYTGVQISFGSEWVTISNTFSHSANAGNGYEQITEEEFAQAFDNAIAMITREVPVFA